MINIFKLVIIMFITACSSEGSKEPLDELNKLVERINRGDKDGAIAILADPSEVSYILNVTSFQDNKNIHPVVKGATPRFEVFNTYGELLIKKHKDFVEDVSRYAKNNRGEEGAGIVIESCAGIQHVTYLIKGVEFNKNYLTHMNDVYSATPTRNAEMFEIVRRVKNDSSIAYGDWSILFIRDDNNSKSKIVDVWR